MDVNALIPWPEMAKRKLRVSATSHKRSGALSCAERAAVERAPERASEADWQRSISNDQPDNFARASSVFVLGAESKTQGAPFSGGRPSLREAQLQFAGVFSAPRFSRRKSSTAAALATFLAVAASETNVPRVLSRRR